jgi:hypothetical protein
LQTKFIQDKIAGNAKSNVNKKEFFSYTSFGILDVVLGIVQAILIFFLIKFISDYKKSKKKLEAQ